MLLEGTFLDQPISLLGLSIPLLHLLAAGGAGAGALAFLLRRHGSRRFALPAWDEEEPVEFDLDRRTRLEFRLIDFKYWLRSRPRIRRWRAERAERREYRELGMKPPLS